MRPSIGTATRSGRARRPSSPTRRRTRRSQQSPYVVVGPGAVGAGVRGGRPVGAGEGGGNRGLIRARSSRVDRSRSIFAFLQRPPARWCRNRRHASIGHLSPVAIAMSGGCSGFGRRTVVGTVDGRARSPSGYWPYPHRTPQESTSTGKTVPVHPGPPSRRALEYARRCSGTWSSRRRRRRALSTILAFVLAIESVSAVAAAAQVDRTSRRDRRRTTRPVAAAPDPAG